MRKSASEDFSDKNSNLKLHDVAYKRQSSLSSTINLSACKVQEQQKEKARRDSAYDGALAYPFDIVRLLIGLVVLSGDMAHCQEPAIGCLEG